MLGKRCLARRRNLYQGGGLRQLGETPRRPGGQGPRGDWRALETRRRGKGAPSTQEAASLTAKPDSPKVGCGTQSGHSELPARDPELAGSRTAAFGDPKAKADIGIDSPQTVSTQSSISGRLVREPTNDGRASSQPKPDRGACVYYRGSRTASWITGMHRCRWARTETPRPTPLSHPTGFGTVPSAAVTRIAQVTKSC